MARHLPLSTDTGAKRSGAVAIVGSAGAIPALIELLAPLPPSFPFPIIIAQHLSRTAPSVLPTVLALHSRLPIKWAEPEEVPENGVIYVVPGDHRLVVGRRGFNLAPLMPRSSDWLRCADVLFYSIALRYGPGAVGIVLSGILPVGTAGLRSITRRGGVTMAQNRRSAAYSEMPTGAIDQGKAEIVLVPRRLSEALIAFAEAREQEGGVTRAPPPAPFRSGPEHRA
ncbi:MAG: chemotaxis protein CheB [Alphaproteobacteria bacterium]